MQRSPCTILAIDTDVEPLARLAKVLGEAGYQCRCAASEHAAAELLRNSSPDLIVCDVNIGGHNGPVMVDRLREQSGTGDVPVMFLNTSQSPDIIRRSHAGGGTYYLRKPFDAHVLLQLVERAARMPHFSGA